MDPILTLSGTALAKKIRDGELSSATVVETHIRHIQKVNPAINAVVKDRFDRARQEAAAADRKVAEGSPEALPPFHGVPCTIKENHACAGMPNTSGLVARLGVVSDEDATTVARLRRAGAVVLGVTNTSELCMWFESTNRVYGRTNNPYDLARIVGGSSGGEGAIIGAGGSPFGLGSDIGGSIRMPAFFNGVFGHKASGGLIPGSGQWPPAANEARRYLCSGPLARRAEDLWPLIKVLAGPDGVDEECRPMELKNPAHVDLAGLDVLVVEGNGAVRVGQDMKDALRSAAACLDRAGARVVRVEMDNLRYSLEIWSSMLTEAGGPSFGELLGNGTPVAAGWELAKWSLRRSPHTLPAIMLALLENLPKRFPKRTRRILEIANDLKHEMTERIGPRGVMLYPSFPTTAPRHGMPLLKPFQYVYTAILNVMELPVTQVPMGPNSRGMPRGVQVAAVHGNDHLTLAVARALEEQFGGWLPPHTRYVN